MKKRTFSIIAILLLNQLIAVAQSKNNDSLNLSKNRAQLSYVGWGVYTGNSAASTGWLGFVWPSISTKYVTISTGLGWNESFKFHFGLSLHTNLKNKFCYFLTSDFVYLPKHTETFFKGEKNQKTYQLSSAQFINAGTALLWHPKNIQDPKFGIGLLFRLGYRLRISGSSIQTDNLTNTKDDNFRKLNYLFYDSRMYWSIGLRFDGLIQNKL